MRNNQITLKESLYLIYAYVSISAFLLLGISKVTDSLEKAMGFNPIISLLIVVNMVIFISLIYYKRRHNTHIHHDHF